MGYLAFLSARKFCWGVDAMESNEFSDHFSKRKTDSPVTVNSGMVEDDWMAGPSGLESEAELFGSESESAGFVEEPIDDGWEHVDWNNTDPQEEDFLGLFNTDGLSVGDLEYEPSCIPTDYSAAFPNDFGLRDVQIPLSKDYDAGRVLESAWRNLPNDEYVLPWDAGFWNKFLDPNKSALDMFMPKLKRPLPMPLVESGATSSSAAVDRRVTAKTFPTVKNFLQNIRDVPERTWREEREAVWETAIRRWVSLLESWDDSRVTLASALKSKTSFTEKAQIVVDVFFNKAPQTLIKRVNSLAKLTNELGASGIYFPCNEDEFYQFLRSEVDSKCSASRLKAYFEAVVFTRYVLNVECLQPLVDSKRCLGAASQSAVTCPKQASPFTVKQLKRFHEVLREASEPWDKAMAGMILFCVYGRSRWSDAQHAEDLVGDYDSNNELCSLEIKTTVHKTARALQFRHMFLPITAPAVGVTDDDWGSQWLKVRDQLSISDLKEYPLLPAPDSALNPTRRPISTSEAKKWMLHLLGSDCVDVNSRISSHSCKSTLLSFLAKRGAQLEDRLVLGYHSNRLRMALTYSRDALARPLALLSHVLGEIRAGIFEPDNSKSGRLKAGAQRLDSFEVFPLPVSSEVSLQSPVLGHREAEMDKTQVTGNPNETVEPACSVAGQDSDGHVTTDSSDSSEDERSVVKPVVGHYRVDIPEDKKLWLNHKSRMFHLSRAENVKTLLCGRKITEGFGVHEGQVRFDSAKCRLCFRAKSD